MPGVVGEEERTLVTVFGIALEWEVDAAEGNRRQGVAVYVLVGNKEKRSLFNGEFSSFGQSIFNFN